MLKANHPDGTEYMAADVPNQNWDVDDPHGIDWRCSVAGCPMQFVDATKRVKHFRHDNERPGHPTPPESQQHRELKAELYNRYKNEDYVKAISVEHYFEDINRIADLAVWLMSGQRFVIEIQLSKQSATKFEERTGDYNNVGFAVLWLLGEGEYINPKQTKKASGWQYMDAIKWLQQQYYGRFYLITQPTGIHPIRFESKSRYVEATKWGGGYTKKYETVANKSHGEWLNIDETTQPRVARKNSEYWNGIRQYDVVTFGEDPWW